MINLPLTGLSDTDLRSRFFPTALDLAHSQQEDTPTGNRGRGSYDTGEANYIGTGAGTPDGTEDGNGTDTGKANASPFKAIRWKKVVVALVLLCLYLMAALEAADV